MNPNPTQPIVSLLAEHKAHALVLQALDELLPKTTEACAVKIQTFDVKDKKAIADVTELLTLEAALPRRITAEQIAHEQLEGRIIDDTNEFISKVFSPRVRALSARALEHAKATLAPLYEDKVRLEQAINNSDLVIELRFITPSITGEKDGGIRHAENVLARWKRVDVAESKLS